MKLNFFKYHGTGNDFIMIDNRSDKIQNLAIKQIKHLCDRRFGIGGDGLIVMSKDEKYHFAMKYFNADGREGTMCGNGGRCIVKFAKDLGIIKNTYKFSASDGLHEGSIENDNSVSLKMNDVENIEKRNANYILDTGSPHFIILC